MYSSNFQCIVASFHLRFVVLFSFVEFITKWWWCQVPSIAFIFLFILNHHEPCPSYAKWLMVIKWQRWKIDIVKIFKNHLGLNQWPTPFCCDDIHFYEFLICHMRNIYVCRTVRHSMMCVNGTSNRRSRHHFKLEVRRQYVVRLMSLNSSFCAHPYFRHHFYMRLFVLYHLCSVTSKTISKIALSQSTKKMKRKRTIFLIKQFIKMKMKIK